MIVHDIPSTNLDERLRISSRLERDVIVLSLEEPTPTSSDPAWVVGLFTPKRAEGSEAEFEEDELSDILMAPSTRLKYSRFQRDGSQDVDDCYNEFESMATANQEDPELKRRIFQRLLRGEALKWYQNVPDGTSDSWADFVTLFLKTLRKVGGDARAMGRLSRMTKKPTKSIWKYGQRVKALIQKLMTKIAESVQVEWYGRRGESRHFPPECNRPFQKRIHYVPPEEEIYHTTPE